SDGRRSRQWPCRAPACAWQATRGHARRGAASRRFRSGSWHLKVSVDPLNEYTARRDRWRAEQEFLQQRFIRIGNWRLVVGIAAAVLAWFIVAQHAIPLWTLLVTVVIF